MGDAPSSKPPPAQIPLDFPLRPSFAREDFLPAACNASALAMIEKWPDWPARLLLLLGPPGSGKSHLAAIWARRAAAREAEPQKLLTLDSLAEQGPAALLVDGLESVQDETALFHLLNFANENNVFLLMSARRAPREESVRLPDLLSRLRRAPVVEIGPPDDQLMRAVLEKLFRDRQLSVDSALVDYVALRLERSLDAARVFVRELDREALARGRRVTRPLAAEVLERTLGG
jgi:chromosomal replication initiation ATPase DnaA